jgi:hypothetical protein
VSRKKNRKPPPPPPKEEVRPSGWTARFRWPWEIPALLLVFALFSLYSLYQGSNTFDEPPHLVAGISYLERGDFRLNPEHPPLAKMWAALPLHLAGSDSLETDSPHWKQESLSQYRLGYEYLNGPIGEPERRNPNDRLAPARIAMVVLGLLLGVIVYLWSRELWGRVGGFVSLFLYCLSPTILAHTRLVTLDLPVAFGFTLASWCFWRFCRRPGWLRGMAVGISFGIALLIKMSAALLIPILGLLWLLWILRGDGESGGKLRRFGLGAAALGGSCVMAALMIWAAYQFRYAPSPDGDYQFDWKQTRLETGVVHECIEFARESRLLPESYLYGFSYIWGRTHREAFLNGERRISGWWYYFPEAFVLKTPPALMILLGWLMWVRIRRGGALSFDGWAPIVPVLVYGVVTLFSTLNIGHRHLVPLYPFLFIFAGAAGGFLRKWNYQKTAVFALLASFFISSLVASPGYLSYFNVIAGGSNGGSRYLVDSNIDWGQDLPRLKAWMDEKGVEEINLAYFGTADPAAHGISCKAVFFFMNFGAGRRAPLESGEYVAISATFVRGVYLNDDSEFHTLAAREHPLPADRIDEWVQLRNERFEAGETCPRLADWVVSEGILTQEQGAAIEARIPQSWIRNFTRGRTPIAIAGDSIFLYRVP